MRRVEPADMTTDCNQWQSCVKGWMGSGLHWVLVGLKRMTGWRIRMNEDLEWTRHGAY